MYDLLRKPSPICNRISEIPLHFNMIIPIAGIIIALPHCSPFRNGTVPDPNAATTLFQHA